MFYKQITKLCVTINSVRYASRFIVPTHRKLACQKRRMLVPLDAFQLASSSKLICHTYCTSGSSPPIDADVIESLEYDVEKFGKLVFRSPMDVHIEPLNPQDYPENNKLFVNIRRQKAKKVPNSNGANFPSSQTKRYSVVVELEHLPEELEVRVHTKEDARKMHLECHIQVPMKYDIDVTSEKHGSLWLKKMESAAIKVRTGQGHCTCQSIKCGKVDIYTGGGNIISQSVLQGNIHLSTTAQGIISTDRLQGQTIECRTDAGDITVRDVYADSSKFETEGGNISIQNCHGNSKIQIDNANLRIGSLDGDLSATMMSGLANVFVAKEGKVNLNNNKGDIKLTVANSVNAAVSLSAVTVDSSVDLHGQKLVKDNERTQVDGRLKAGESRPEASISAVAHKGKITLDYQDWFSSLKLDKGLD